MLHDRRLLSLVIASVISACGDDGDGDAEDVESSTSLPGDTTGDASSGASSGASSESSDGSVDGSTGDATTSDTGAAESSTTGEPLPPCPEFAEGAMVGIVMETEIVEASGVAVSRMHDDRLWLHNDSGAGPRVLAIDSAGSTLAALTLDDAIALDWEDMALGPGPDPGVDYLYMGDIGDNAELRATITVYRVPEPEPAVASGTLDGVVPLVFAYPDGAHNAETLLSDPESGDLFVVTKSESGMSGVFRAAFPHDERATIELELVAELAFGTDELPGNALATGGDVAADGSLIAIRTYSGAFAWRRAAGATIAEAFATEACPLPTVDEPQGEAIAIGTDGYYTISEGETPPVWFFAASP